MPEAGNDKGLVASLLTPPGEGGISVIALTGTGAADLARQRLKRPAGRGAAPMAPGEIYYGMFTGAGGEPLDEVVVACVCEEYVEINCHGGALPARLVIKSLEGAGAAVEERRTPPGRRSLVAEEAFEALFKASTGLAARVLAAQAGGLLEGALVEAARHVKGRDAARARLILRELLGTCALGAALVEPPVITVAGPVNAGKSTLVNALVGYARTIVTDVPGTTRDAVRVPAALEGVPVVLVDTAGAAAVRTSLERKAARAAAGALEEAAAVLYVYDSSVPLEDAPRPPAGRPSVIAANKSDLAPCAATLEAIRATGLPFVETSGLSGAGMGELSSMLLETLGIGPPAADLPRRPVVFTERQHSRLSEAAEAIDAGDHERAYEKIAACIEGS